MNTSASVSVHVRTGENVNHLLLAGICNLDYYKKAIDLILSKVPNAAFFVFSNDLDCCRKNLPITNAVYVEENDGHNSASDMHLMSCCRNNIIANSSFSWWADWLNRNPGKRVVAPNRWVNGKPLPADFAPKDWITI